MEQGFCSGAADVSEYDKMMQRSRKTQRSTRGEEPE